MTRMHGVPFVVALFRVTASPDSFPVHLNVKPAFGGQSSLLAQRNFGSPVVAAEAGRPAFARGYGGQSSLLAQRRLVGGDGLEPPTLSV
jgi:hypothetical protein